MSDVPDYVLAPEAIAQTPVEPRDDARLLVAPRDRSVQHRRVFDLPELVGEGDVIVLNETKVIPARLKGHKPTGGAVEVFLLEKIGDGQSPGFSDVQEWQSLVRPSARVAPGTAIVVEAPVSSSQMTPVSTTPIFLEVVVQDHLDGGLRRVQLRSRGGDVDLALGHFGEIPLPPYVKQALDDPSRYQTVYAAQPGSVAAPTAGLHLTPEVLERCRERGAAIATIDLAVGLGTFRPITVDRLSDHEMHSERYDVPIETMEACRAARRVWAIGTTTARALESAAATGEMSGTTKLLISGDYPWLVVDWMLTNFHQPRSTLLAMIESFVGPGWRDLYQIALDERYRFLSFGDAMAIQASERARRGARVETKESS